METRPDRCSRCGSRSVAAIFYGLPNLVGGLSQELQRDLSSGRVVFGGCSVSADSPRWRCNQCGEALRGGLGPRVGRVVESDGRRTT
jgi:hypothetical protein